MAMRPCNKCLENTWKFKHHDGGIIEATCLMCGHEVQFLSRRAQKVKAGIRIGRNLTTTWELSPRGDQWRIIDGVERHFSEFLSKKTKKVRPLPIEECMKIWDEVIGRKTERGQLSIG